MACTTINSSKFSKIKAQMFQKLRLTRHNRMLSPKRRFWTTFNAARATLNKKRLHQSLWSGTALDAIEKLNYLPPRISTEVFYHPTPYVSRRHLIQTMFFPSANKDSLSRQDERQARKQSENSAMYLRARRQGSTSSCFQTNLPD